jgi:hypothetical protein
MLNHSEETGDATTAQIAPSLRRPLVAAAAGLIMTAAIQAAYRYLTVMPWLTVVVMLIIILAAVAVLAFITRPNPLGFAGAAINTYCIIGLMTASRTGTTAVIEQVVIVPIALAALRVIGTRAHNR